MSKIEELIMKLCPNGVLIKPLGEICEIRSGWGFPNAEQGLKFGDYPFFKVGDMNHPDNIPFMTVAENYISVETANKLKCKPAPKGTIIFPKIGAAIATNKKRILTEESCYDNNVMGVIAGDEVDDRFLYYVMEKHNLMEFSNGEGAVPSIRKSAIEKCSVPVPPLEVQREIVHVLDRFTLLSAEFSVELSAELKGRKLQYEYYKDSILPFANETAIWKSLGSISTIVRGASPRPIKSFITDKEDGVNWIKIGDAAPGAKYITSCAERITQEGATKSRRVHPGDFVLSNSMSFGRPYILKVDGCIHDGWLSISDFDDYLTPDYLYHVLTSSYIQRVMEKKASFGGAVQNLNADIVREIEVPVPTIDEQNRVTSVLDRFASFCTDIEDGITAEIEAREKQYEYYRDKLLTFKEIETA